MSNIKLKDHNWAAEGIYDTNQSKSQQTINSDVNTKIGQATLQTSSQNLSGAANELKGRADTLDSKYDNVVTVANTQPSSEYNKVWLPLTVSEGTQVPTWAEHQELSGAITSLRSTDTSIADAIAFIETNWASASRDFAKDEFIYSTTYGRFYRLKDAVSKGTTFEGHVYWSRVGSELKSLRDSTSGEPTPFNPQFYCGETQATVTNKQFIYLMAGRGFMVISGRYSLDNKNGAADNTSLIMTLPDGYVCNSANPGPIGVSWGIDGTENFIIRTVANAAYITFTSSITGNYSTPRIPLGWHAFFGVIPVKKT